MEERLQKIIARAGIASRRRAEELMESGLVTVNGKTVTELGTKADLSRDHIKVAGKLIRATPEHVYFALHKPPEVVATMSDPEGRRSLSDLLHGVAERVFPAGRMEYHSSGLILLTNDGELANQILRSHLRQTWHFKLKTLLTFDEIEKLGRSTGAHISRIPGKDSPWYEIVIPEARREAVLRNRLFQSGHFVEKMKRVAVGNIGLGDIKSGAHRSLSPSEVATLEKVLRGEEIPKSVTSTNRRPRERQRQRSKKKLA